MCIRGNKAARRPGSVVSKGIGVHVLIREERIGAGANGISQEGSRGNAQHTIAEPTSQKAPEHGL